MHNLQSAQPTPALRPFVRAYAQRNYASPSLTIEPSPPRLEAALGFSFSDGLTVCLPDGTRIKPPVVTVVGSRLDRGLQVCLEGSVEYFAVFFQPAGFAALFDIPMHQIVNSSCDATAVLGSSVVSLGDRLATVASFAARVHLAEAHLLHRIAGATSSLEMHAANAILRHRGIVRIRKLADFYGMSVRQFERRFATAIGVPPKPFARVARFQSALDAKLAAPARTWCDIAHALGYHDQMHLIHDVSQLGGNVPQELVDTLGDARPPALAAADRSERYT